MKLSTLILIDKLLSARVDELQIKVSNSRYLLDKRMSELGIGEYGEYEDSDDLTLSNIQDHFEACTELLSEYVCAYNDFKGVDWS